MLDLCKKIFNEFELNGINYCHWKSNEHLAEGLNGRTDLDILIDKTHYNKINSILFSLGVKRYEALQYLRYISIEDYFGIDNETGKLIHIHLHYELKIGQKFIKEYHLPFERYIFNNLPPKANNPIQTIDPNIEMILLLVRFALKSQYKPFSNTYTLTKDYQAEFEWLMSRVDINLLEKKAVDILGNQVAGKLTQYILNRNDKKCYQQLRQSIIEATDIYKVDNSLKLFMLYYLYRFRAGYNYVMFKKLKAAIPYRRVDPSGGKIIVFIGVDGAGKSTLIREVEKWMSWKIDVLTLYFGSGEGRSSLLRYPLVALTRLIKKKRSIINNRASSTSNEIVKSESMKGSLAYRVFKSVWAITLAFEKKRKLKKMWLARAKGLTVLCDRFPQTQIQGFNDGPLLSKWHNSNEPLKRRIAKWELNIYEMSKFYKPDMVIKLIVPEEISLKRKSDTPLEMIRKKINAIELIKYDEEVIVYYVDSSGTIEDTLLKIQRLIAKL